MKINESISREIGGFERLGCPFWGEKKNHQRESFHADNIFHRMSINFINFVACFSLFVYFLNLRNGYALD